MGGRRRRHGVAGRAPADHQGRAARRDRDRQLVSGRSAESAGKRSRQRVDEDGGGATEHRGIRLDRAHRADRRRPARARRRHLERRPGSTTATPPVRPDPRCRDTRRGTRRRLAPAVAPDPRSCARRRALPHRSRQHRSTPTHAPTQTHARHRSSDEARPKGRTRPYGRGLRPRCDRARGRRDRRRRRRGDRRSAPRRRPTADRRGRRALHRHRTGGASPRRRHGRLGRHRRGSTAASSRARVPVSGAGTRRRRDGSVAPRPTATRRGARRPSPCGVPPSSRPPGRPRSSGQAPEVGGGWRRGRGHTEIGVPVVAGTATKGQ